MANVVITAMREQIRAAVVSITGLPEGRVFDASSVDHVFELARLKGQGTSIGVRRTAMTKAQGQAVGERGPKLYVTRWSLVVVGSSYQTTAGALTRATGIDEVEQLLLGALPFAEVQPSWYGDGVHLSHLGSDEALPKYRVPTVGEIGLDMKWEAEEVSL